jgi:transposase-like protein
VYKGENGRYPLEVRLWAVEQMRAGVSIGEVAKRVGASVRQVHRWKKNPINPDRKRKRRPAEEVPQELTPQGELQKVKQALAEKVLELDFLKGALRRIEARRQKSASSGETTSTEKSKP